MIHLNDIIMFGIQLKIVWLIVVHYQLYLVKMIMYVVEHDEFDIHDNMHVNIYHNNMMLLNSNVHDKILLKVKRQMKEDWVDYRYLRIVERRMN